jgi:hypothetical protein
MSKTTHDLTQRAEDLEHDLRLLNNELQADIVRDLLSAIRLATQEATTAETKAALAQCMRWRGEEREQRAAQEATIRQVEDYIRLIIHNRIEQQIVVPTLMLEKWADTLRACTGETQK